MLYKILYVNKTSEIGGAEISLKLLLKHLDRNRFNPVVLLPSEGAFVNDIRALGVDVLIVPLSNIRLKELKPLQYFKTVLQLIRIIRKADVSLVHANDIASSQYSIVAARLARVPVVSHMRGLASKSTVRRAFLSCADKIIANSKATADTFLAHRNNPRKIEVIYNGVELDEYAVDGDKGERFRSRFGIGRESFVIGTAGRIFPDKGFHIAVRAVCRVREKYKDVYLLIIGPTEADSHLQYQKDDNYFVELKKIIVSLGMQRAVIFTGYQEDMISAYRAMDIFIFPTFVEGFGRVIIEAMAQQRPVVASAVGGIPEIIEDDVNGLLVPPGDSNALAEGIIKMRENEKSTIRMAELGRIRVKNVFSITEHVEKTQSVYMEVLKRGG